MNFGEMVAQIADDLIDERVSNLQIQNAVNQALKFYRRKTFYFNTIKTNIAVVPGTEYYALTNISTTSASIIELSESSVSEGVPLGTIVGILSVTVDPAFEVDVADLYSIENIKFTPDSGADGWRLAPMMDATLENSRAQSNSFSPAYYAYAQMRIRVSPIPSISGTLSVLATRMHPPFVLDTDTNVFLERADELIRQAAKRYIAYNNLHDSALGDRCAALEAEEFASLRAENMNREPVLEMRVPYDLAILPSANTFYDVVNDR